MAISNTMNENKASGSLEFGQKLDISKHMLEAMQGMSTAITNGHSEVSNAIKAGNSGISTAITAGNDKVSNAITTGDHDMTAALTTGFDDANKAIYVSKGTALIL